MEARTGQRAAPNPLTVNGRLKPAAAAGRPSAVPAQVIASETLFGQAREVLILHNNRLYRLRVTMSGKLVLTA
ncbi:MAG: hemin uptake protein HemP [Burkholderiaceae bacterium]